MPHFYQKIIKKYPPNKDSIVNGYQKSQHSPSYNIILTGHSLGAYTAVGVGQRSGVLTRVFSSPGTHIIRKYYQLFSNTMRLSNVINFVRKGDPVSTLTGRHDENMVFYPEAAFKTSPDNHLLVPFIKQILEKLYQNQTDPAAIAREIYITPDTMLGGGLKQRSNDWGSVP